MRRSIGTSRLLSVGFWVIAAIAGDAFSATFTNPTAIVIPGPGSSSGTSIAVSGLGVSISSITVRIDSFSDTREDDVGLVLVGPTGAALALQGDCGGSGPATFLNITYSDGLTLLPQNLGITVGTYAPTQYASLGSFPSPGPGTAYNSPAPVGTFTLFSTFSSTNPNGIWSLYAIDPVSGDSGEITDGWNLTITATGTVAPATPLPRASLALPILGLVLLLRRHKPGAFRV